MCGIVGIGSSRAIREEFNLSDAITTLSHRGPDDSGVWWSKDRRVGLAHSRLSIVDLSKAASQPMISNDNRVVIAFNGEIYNYLELKHILEQYGHHFRTTSDTEVLIASYQQWGIKCLDRLKGMFAFSLYDSCKGLLFLARDRAGEKPLFLHQAKGEIRFASELKALLKDPELTRQIDHRELESYLTFGFVSGTGCILKGFSKLPPGHALIYDIRTEKTRIWSYWKLPNQFPQNFKPGSSEVAAATRDTLNELEELLERSVREQLEADVPVGVLLSGGVDSSIITALATRSKQSLKTFTVGFKGEEGFDERAHAQLVADHFKTEHIELEADPSDASILPLLVKQFDEPMADSSMLPTFMVSQLVRDHCTVALGGDGGDELFGGYKRYNEYLKMANRFGRIPLLFRKSVSSTAERILPIGYKGRNWALRFGIDWSSPTPIVASYFDGVTRRKLLGDKKRLYMDELRNSQGGQQHDLLRKLTSIDFQNYLPEDLLVKVDRASMLSSLEIRAPFLSHEVIEFAFGNVPSYMKVFANDRKILLKELGKLILPPSFDYTRKQGFSIPLASWFRKGPIRDLAIDTLFGSSTMFSKREITKILSSLDRGWNNADRLYALLFFELWRKEYKVSG